MQHTDEFLNMCLIAERLGMLVLDCDGDLSLEIYEAYMSRAQS